jgi:large subunit ribosomal protein L10
MPNTKNKQVVATLKEKVQKAKSIIFADYLGLKAEEMNDLRRQIREDNAELTIARNTLVKIALKEEGYDTSKVETDLEGPTATVFAYEDAISPIKKLFDFGKTLELPKIKGAFVNRAYTDANQAETLSKLPSKEELLTRTVRGMKAPLSGFVNVLGGVQRNFVYAIKAIADKRGVSE